MKAMVDFSEAIDWLSIKLTGASIILATITWSKFTAVLSGIALLSTIVYNAIRIFKELKNKKP